MINLISLAEYKEAENIRSNDADAQLLSYIESVSQLVKTYCGIAFLDYYVSPKVETINVAFERSILFLTESPVRDIISVEIKDNPRATYTLLDTTYYIADRLTDSISYFTDSGYPKTWPLGPDAVRVTYTAGYSECPKDLRLAVFDLINYYKNDEHKPRQSLGSSNRENPEESRSTVQFPPHIKRVLDLYKVHV